VYSDGKSDPLPFELPQAINTRVNLCVRGTALRFRARAPELRIGVLRFSRACAGRDKMCTLFEVAPTSTGNPFVFFHATPAGRPA